MPGRRQAPRKAHVGHAGPPRRVEEHVGGLQVAVQDGRLGCLQRLHALRDPQRHAQLVSQTALGRPSACMTTL